MRALVKFARRPDAETIGTVQLGENDRADMMASGLRILSQDELKYVRSQLLTTYKRLADARTVVITLGYGESWRETQDGIFVNRATVTGNGSFGVGDPNTINGNNSLCSLTA